VRLCDSGYNAVTYFTIVTFQTVILQIRVYVLFGGSWKVAILMVVLWVFTTLSSTIIGSLTDVRVKGMCFHSGSHIPPLTAHSSSPRSKPSQNLFPEFISAQPLAFPVGAVWVMCRLSYMNLGYLLALPGLASGIFWKLKSGRESLLSIRYFGTAFSTFYCKWSYSIIQNTQ
jgi:hypothetical protein